MTEDSATPRTTFSEQHERERVRLLRGRGAGPDGPGPPGRQMSGVVSSGLNGIHRALSLTHPRAIVLDNFLSPDAFKSLQDYLIFGNVWREVAHGMLAARSTELSKSPLVHQIVEELRIGAPELFAPYHHVSYWAFKNLLPIGGTGLHADAAAVTVNLWLTDDSANKDPTAGGLVVWDAHPPGDWGLPDYNSQDEEHQERIRRHIERLAPLRLHVPYRANRCVIFESTLFHASDAVLFGDTFLCRRINLTILFSRPVAQRRTTGDGSTVSTDCSVE